MLLTPRYDDEPLVTIAGQIDDPAVPLLRQRRRLGDVLRGLGDQQWAAPSRCEAWSVQGVIAHLDGTNGFWAFAMKAALGGEPTRFLGTFDPVATPLAMVDGMKHLTPADVLAQYDESVDAMAAVVTGLDRDAWSMLGEAPPGHVSLEAVALHALWDAWTHERDCLLPLGLAQVEEPDEILGSLRYAAALGPAFSRTHGSDQQGQLAVVATDPDVSFVVDIGATTVVVTDGVAPDGTPALRGTAIGLLEALSFRLPFEEELPAEHRWLVGGLDAVFDRT
jgi:uncharacterized protein (TIGR03083 family)